MIRRCDERDFDAILEIVNDGARAYRGVIPDDRWTEPYMPREKLRAEIDGGVEFWGWRPASELVGVMGLQHVRDVTLVRHAYVRTAGRRQGVGGRLLAHLLASTERPVLVGTWAAAHWAVDFYRRAGFALVPPADKDRLLAEYWDVPPRQVETSVVLADARWREREARRAPLRAT